MTESNTIAVRELTQDIKFKILDNHPRDIPISLERGSKYSAGFDLRTIEDDRSIHPGEIQIHRTGLAISMPWDMEMQIRPRSGLAIRQGITVVNSPGTVDSDYRGEIMVGLINLSSEIRFIKHGERIAQGVFAPVVSVNLIEVPELDETDRGEGGFGSTGRT